MLRNGASLVAVLAFALLEQGTGSSVLLQAQSAPKSALAIPPPAARPTPRSSGRARLVYSLWDGMLVGTVGGRPLSMRALSGGGGGSTRKATDPFAVNNPVTTDQAAQRSKGIRGGPIPPGEYTILVPAKSPAGHVIAALIPRYKTERSGFQIHGRGPLGSDGCIVPLEAAQFSDLIARLTRDSGGILTVIDGSSRTGFR